MPRLTDRNKAHATFRTKKVYIESSCGAYYVYAEDFLGQRLNLAYFDKNEEGKKEAEAYVKKMKKAMIVKD